MRQIKLPQLNAYSWEFSQKLFAAFPQWRKYISDQEDATRMGNLRVLVPSRLGPYLPLYIITEHEQVEVGWGFCHAHFPDEDDQDRQECFRRVLLFLEELISDKRVIVDDWKGGRVAGCTMCLLTEVTEHLGTGSTVRSWSGTHDKGEYDPRKLY